MSINGRYIVSDIENGTISAEEVDYLTAARFADVLSNERTVGPWFRGILHGVIDSLENEYSKDEIVKMVADLSK